MEGANYSDLKTAIKAYGIWAKITESTWAIVTVDSAKDIRENLLQYIPTGGRIFVLKSGSESAWRNVICSNEWLKKNL